MNRFLKILPGLTLTAYFTLGNMAAFRVPVMRSVSIAGTVLMAACLYLQKQRGGLSPIDRGFLIFMALNAIGFWCLPPSLTGVMADFSAGILYLILLAVAALPALFAGRYFTEYFARKRTPEAVWETAIFKTINRRMTWTWAALFALCTLVTALPFLLSMTGTLLTGLLFQVLIPISIMTGIGLPFNRWYPDYYTRKSGIGTVRKTETIPVEGPAERFALSEQRKKEEPMFDRLTVVAVNGSPHGAIGSTSRLIQMIGQALSREGIACEEILLESRKIEYCVGCAVCLEHGRCWRRDDHAGITDKLFAADGIILASPVYFRHVTAQLKTFLDRSLGFGHKPRPATKPGLAVTVSAGLSDVETARYLEGMLRVYGAFPIGSLIAIATNPGCFLGKEDVEVRAGDLARDMARAIREKRRYPATGDDLHFYLFMRDLVTREKELMRDDYRYWQETGISENFEAYARQQYAGPTQDPALRTAWIRSLMKEERAREKGMKEADTAAAAAGPAAQSCRELLELMPRGFQNSAAKGLRAIYQFEISGTESFTAHLQIGDNRCMFHEGPAEHPDVIIKSSAAVWLAISNGEMNGQRAFLSGKYTVEGDLALLLKLKELFRRE